MNLFKNIETSEVDGSLLISFSLSEEEVSIMESILNEKFENKEVFHSKFNDYINSAIINFLESNNAKESAHL